MRREYKEIAVLLSALALASVALPMMSVYCAGGECGTIPARIYNLVEFSIAGAAPMLAPILLLVTALIHIPQRAKALAVIGIIAADAVCMAAAAKATYTWLTEIGTESVQFHPVCMIYWLIATAAALTIVLPQKKEDVND